MAMTGFLLNDTCVSTLDDALLLFVSKYPIVESGVIHTINLASVTPPNVLNIEFVTSDLLKNSASVFISKSFYLLSCDPAISIPHGMAWSADTAAQFWSFGLLMVLGSWLVANNVGLILNAIKRW